MSFTPAESEEFTLSLEALVSSIYTPETYRAFYDEAICLAENVTLTHRVDAPGNFNFCSVPLGGADAFLFATLALLVASLCIGKLALVLVLVTGGVLGIVNYEANLLRVSNAISLWLGISPPDLFFYAFLPPLLMDAALKLEWFVFKKMSLHIVVLAYVMVVLNALVMTPFILYALGFSGRGMDWVHGAIFAALLAPTDAVAVTAILKTGGGPEGMVTLLEGEALLNDASGITLYTVFMKIMESYPPDAYPTVTSLIPSILLDTVKLTAIGAGVGLAFGFATGYLLRWLRWRGVPAYVQAVLTISLSYMAFYIGQAPAGGSGVIAVCVFGLWGSATHQWGMLAADQESGLQLAVWDTVAFVANGLVFFWAGVSSVNFVARSTEFLSNPGWSYGSIPIIYIMFFVCRFVFTALFSPLFRWVTGVGLSLPQITFATVSGLRGALSLIMLSDFVVKSNFLNGNPALKENANIVVWTSAFVLLTLVVNAPLIGPVMRWTGLSRVTREQLRARPRALAELGRFTEDKVDELQAEPDEFLQGANWAAVSAFVDHTPAMQRWLPEKQRTPGSQPHAWWRFWSRGAAAAPPSEPAVGRDSLPSSSSEEHVTQGGEAPSDSPRVWQSEEQEVPFINISRVTMRPSSRPSSMNDIEAGQPQRGGLSRMSTAAAGAASRLVRFRSTPNVHSADVEEGAAVAAAAAQQSKGREEGDLHSEDDEDDVTVLFSKDSGAERATEGDAARAPDLFAGAQQPAPLLDPQLSSALQPAVLGSERDLLGRRTARSKGPSAEARAPPAQSLSRALRTRTISRAAGATSFGRASAGSAKAEGPPTPRAAAEAGEVREEEATPLELRLKAITGLRRYFQQKRQSGMLSTNSLGVLNYACERAAEHLEEHPQEPLGMWHYIMKEISGKWLTALAARTLASTMRCYRGAPSWWRTLTAWPYNGFTSLLRRFLGGRMLMASEVAIEYYLGLTSSPQLQWVYSGEGEGELLDEVGAEQEAAHTFIAEQEAEAPTQHHAIQSYRAAMAVLRAQRAFCHHLYVTAVVEEGERDELLAAVDAKTRQLDLTGPVWLPPRPRAVVRSLETFRQAPDRTEALLRQANLLEFKPDELVWALPPAPGLPKGGLYVVVSGVVRCVRSTAGGEEHQLLRGVGTIVGALPAMTGGTALPAAERVEAQGNTFGRGPLVYRFPQAALDALLAEAHAGDKDSRLLADALLKVAAVHAAEGAEVDLHGTIRAYLQQHRPLGKYRSGGTAGTPPEAQLPARATRYAAQVLLDVLQGVSHGQVQQLAPGERLQRQSHVVLLCGSLAAAPASGGGGGKEVAAPAVLPWLVADRFSFLGEAGVRFNQQATLVAGSSGAVVVCCSGG